MAVTVESTDHWRTKLDDNDWRRIRTLREVDAVSITDIARRYGVSRELIWKGLKEGRGRIDSRLRDRVEVETEPILASPKRKRAKRGFQLAAPVVGKLAKGGLTKLMHIESAEGHALAADFETAKGRDEAKRYAKRRAR